MITRVLLNELSLQIKLLDRLFSDLTKLDPIQEYSGAIGRAGLIYPYTDDDMTINRFIGELDYIINFMSQAINNLNECQIIKKK